MEINYYDAGTAEFLGEIKGFELPTGCLFNKVLTGCGGTSVALRSEKPYVIAMPYVDVIKSKVVWCNENSIDVIPVYSEANHTEEDIRNASKILVTYDSLKKVVAALGEKVRDYSILVDEYHLLTKSGDFRYRAINEVLGLYKKFKDFVFMTATPIKRKYLPEAIQDLPEVQVKWDNIEPVTLDYTMIEQKNLYPVVAGIAKKHYSGEMEGNCYFFINSVKAIVKIAKYLKRVGIKHSDIRIICADNQANQAFINMEFRSEKYRIENVTTLPKKINFLTSKAFEGSDLLDEHGICYIISDGCKDHTKYDIMTTIPQIIGRIRDAKLKRWAKVIFSPSVYFSYTTPEEYEREVSKRLEEAKEVVNEFNTTRNSTIREAYYTHAQSSEYIIVTDDQRLVVNDTAKKAEMSNFEAIHTTYYVKRSKDGKIVQNNGSRTQTINYVPYVFKSTVDSEIVLNRLEKVELGVGKPSFAEYCDIYESYQMKPEEYNMLTEAEEAEVEMIEQHYPLIPEAFRELGCDRIKTLKYNKKHIMAEILKKKHLTDAFKIRQLLDTEHVYRVGRKVSWADVKKDLQEAFDLLVIKRVAKATDLEHIFIVKRAPIKRKGEFIEAYKIIATR